MPDEAGSTDLYLTDVSPTDKPWDTHRAMATKIEGLYELTDFKQYADRIGQCSRQLGFCLEKQEDGSYRLKLHLAKFCRVRHCAVCQWRRMLMWRARFFQALPRVVKDYPTARWVFLTLTVQNCPLEELRQTMQGMNKAWERLSKRKQFPALGWVKSVEVTRSVDGAAHPHFHCLLMVPASYFSHGYMKQADWTELWKQALRADYTPIVNVKAVKPRRMQPEAGEALEPQAGVIAALLETIKYTVKPEDLAGPSSTAGGVSNARWLEELTNQLHKTRAIAVGGVLRQYVSEEEPEDLVHTEGEEQTVTEEDLQIWFGWREMVQRYAKDERNAD